jgi:hypothetical protein
MFTAIIAGVILLPHCPPTLDTGFVGACQVVDPTGVGPPYRCDLGSFTVGDSHFGSARCRW